MAHDPDESAVGKRLGNRRRVIGGFVVDQHEFNALVGQMLTASANVEGLVPGGDDGGQPHFQILDGTVGGLAAAPNFVTFDGTTIMILMQPRPGR